jgi:NAD(P)H-dependent FMN reductase
VTRPLVILGSARADGETGKAVALVFPGDAADLILLPQYWIGGYDYDHRNAGDDFAELAARMQAASAIVFATPVYWYAMSAPLKIFFDRLTDLTENLKSAGKALAGKPVWLIATGTDPELPEGFEVPFRRTAEYFGMDYRGSIYAVAGAQDGTALAQFGAKVRG